MGQEPTGTVLFVGSVPGENVEEVFRRCARAVGRRAFAFPDGELGVRQMWVGAIGDLAYSQHPGLERLPDTTLPFGSYRAPADVSFDDVYPYTRYALESYRIFRSLRETGELPDDARFQVSLPTAHAATVAYFPDAERWPELFLAWSQAMRKGFDDILAEVPAADLVVQLDYCTEFSDIAGAAEPEERLAALTDPSYLAPMTADLPEETALGYHICLGTWPHWPLSPQPDLGLVVEIANRLIANTPRRVDFLHLPVMTDAGEAYFAPLRNLTAGPKVFLGLECRDGAAALRHRSAAASTSADDFGIAHFCGYGREDAHRIDDLLGDLAAGADALTASTDAASRPPAPAGFDPFSQDFLADPHVFWQTARDRPVFFYEPLRCWVLSRHEDVERAFKDWRTFSSQVLRVAPLPADTRVTAETQAVLTELMAHAIINMDPPEHTIHRKSTQQAFTRPLVTASEPMIRALADELIDGFVDRGECDLVADYFHQLTIGVIVRMADMPPEILPRFRGWIDDLQGLMTVRQFDEGDDAEVQLPAPVEVLEERYVRVAEAYPTFQAYLDARRAQPSDDLASAMLQATNDDGTPAMSYEHILGHIVGLAVAGSETTTGLMSQIVRAFDARPELLTEVLAAPDLWDAAIEEGLRRFAVVNNVLRVTTADVEVAGVTIPARSPVLLNIAGANSDAGAFADPLAFDLHRPNRGDHLGFGLGRHFCLGAPLARLEARCALEALYRRLPGLRVVPDQELLYKTGVTVRGMRQLLISWA